ncbi:hypothetical protein Enr10x_47630 [Gimesia panareensis]|uniref:Uncharacterized protein n=1 Tax=Gimesia panareensis TaxID=2527978 RepID=A0A517QCR2_9PLAN|nr:hypothetical protein Enr10x_47630 [Gimesia panareensis]
MTIFLCHLTRPETESHKVLSDNNLQPEIDISALLQTAVSGKKVCLIIPKIVLTNRTNSGIDLITTDSLRQRLSCAFIINTLI